MRKVIKNNKRMIKDCC